MNKAFDSLTRSPSPLRKGNALPVLDEAPTTKLLLLRPLSNRALVVAIGLGILDVPARDRSARSQTVDLHRSHILINTPRVPKIQTLSPRAFRTAIVPFVRDEVAVALEAVADESVGFRRVGGRVDALAGALVVSVWLDLERVVSSGLRRMRWRAILVRTGIGANFKMLKFWDVVPSLVQPSAV